MLRKIPGARAPLPAANTGIGQTVRHSKPFRHSTIMSAGVGLSGRELSSCPLRPGCAGATVCSTCLEIGIARVSRKLLQSDVAAAQFPELIRSVWPESSQAEGAAVSRELAGRGIALQTEGGRIQHALKPLLAELAKIAVVGVDPAEFLRVRNAGAFESLLTPQRLAAAGLHQLPQPGTRRMLVRQKTFLNCTDIATLEAALKRRGAMGTPMERVYEEYAEAHADIFVLQAEGKVSIEEGLAWHASIAPAPRPGAAEAWRDIAGI